MQTHIFFTRSTLILKNFANARSHFLKILDEIDKKFVIKVVKALPLLTSSHKCKTFKPQV